ncbi:hypothetical protein V0242_11315 [Aeromonas hydrophila]|uniref:hypothetical protein n=1 Tax=Aeromonas hydrophila TaxID=644 RepID=UPI002ED24F18|nr:hypothetical protein V0242_11315 [Aeromonas hydrophila]
MKDKLRSIFEQGSIVAGWVKVLTIVFAIMTGGYAYYYNTQSEINTLKTAVVEEQSYRKNHYGLIQKNDKDILLLVVSVKNLEKELSTYKGEQKQVNYEQSQFNNETLKALVRLNTVNEQNDKQSAKQR